MRKALHVGLAGIAAVLASPAMGQDSITASADTGASAQSNAPAVRTTPDPITRDNPFTGFYVGGSFGYAVQPNDVGSSVLFDRNLDGSFGDTVLTGTRANAFSPGFCNGAAITNAAAGGCRNDKDGIEYYGRVGIDSQVGPFVVGVVGEFGRPEITDGVTAFSVTPANYVLTREIDWEATIRGRIGLVAGRSTLFYGAFGPGYANIERDFRSSQSTNTFTQRGKRRQFGVTGGGGVEQMIGNNFSVGLEYMHHRYQDDDFRVRVAGGPPNTPFTNTTNGGTAAGTDFRRSDDKFRWHSIRGTVNFRF